MFFCFFFNDPATPEIYTLSLHDALPICVGVGATIFDVALALLGDLPRDADRCATVGDAVAELIEALGLVRTGETVFDRSEEHTSELQSLAYLVCRLLLEKKKIIKKKKKKRKKKKKKQKK